MISALLTPIGAPFCEIPLITIFEVSAGSGDNKVMVLPASELSAIANITESCVAVPLAAHCVIASRRLPGPLSLFVVTMIVFPKTVVFKNSKTHRKKMVFRRGLMAVR
jgi:hypothetical protein